MTTLSPTVTPHYDCTVADVDVAAQNDGAGDLQVGNVLAKQKCSAVVRLEANTVGDVNVVTHRYQPGLGGPYDLAVDMKILNGVHTDTARILLRRMRMTPQFIFQFLDDWH